MLVNVAKKIIIINWHVWQSDIGYSMLQALIHLASRKSFTRWIIVAVRLITFIHITRGR